MAIAPAEPPAGLCQVQVAVLAKAPMPGLAKTRLIPHWGHKAQRACSAD